MSDVITTVGNTTLTRVSGVSIYTDADKAALRIFLRDKRELKAAMACLTRDTHTWAYLKQRLQDARRQSKARLDRITPVHMRLEYQGQASVVTNTNDLKRSWKDLRDRIRAEVRRRRHNMREVLADTWVGFMRGGFPNASRQPVTLSRYNNGVNLVRVCGVHTEPNQYRHAYVGKLRAQFLTPKAPRETDARRWVSVEIECILGTVNEAFYDHALAQNVAQYVCVKSDGSLRRDAGDTKGTPVEIVVSAPKEEIERVIKGVCAALKACEAYVNKTCGLHIHLDMRNFDRATAFSNLVAGQKVLRSLVPEHRVKNRFCKPVGRRDWPVNDDRYKAVNHCAWRRHRTIEVRLFAGCIDATKIIGYVKVCSAMAYAQAPVKRAPSSAKGWQKANPDAVDTALIDWVKDEARAIAIANEAERAATGQQQLPLGAQQ